MMLSLQSATSADWLPAAIAHLDEVLIDHAHCEKKAAGTAMNLMFAYPDLADFCRALSEIVVEELDHFRQVLDLLHERGIAFRRLRPGKYGGRLHALVRTFEPARAVDRLLIAGLIEARSCERFDVLRRGIADPQLAGFYDSLFESEARHHATYVRLATMFADETLVMARLKQLSADEAVVLALGDDVVRMHS